MRVYARCVTGLEDVWISRMEAPCASKAARARGRGDDRGHGIWRPAAPATHGNA
jgi:hypothetical protein